MDRIINESPWMTIVAKSDLEVEINIEGIIGGSFWDEEEDGAINTKEQMRNELKAIGQTQASKIIVNINSYGGDVNHGISIYDMLAQNKAEIITRVNGFTASIATVIAMAGDRREISSNSLFLIHKPSLMMLGGFNANELSTRIEQLNMVDARIRDIYIKRGAINYIVDRLMEENEGAGKWLDADEARENLFVDHVFEPMKMAACVNEPAVLKNLGIAGIPDNFINRNIMTEETKTVKGMFDELKTFITNLIKPEAKEGDEGKETPVAKDGEILVAPAELNAKLTAFQTALDAIESNEEAVTQVETLTAEKATITAQVETLTAENKTKADKIVELEGKLTKLNGKSTGVEGPEGLEDPDETNLNPEQKALKNDLANLRGEMTNVHS